jgi:hypothetical protein
VIERMETTRVVITISENTAGTARSDLLRAVPVSLPAPTIRGATSESIVHDKWTKASDEVVGFSQLTCNFPQRQATFSKDAEVHAIQEQSSPARYLEALSRCDKLEDPAHPMRIEPIHFTPLMSYTLTVLAALAEASFFPSGL